MGNDRVAHRVQGGNDLGRHAIDVGITLAHLLVERVGHGEAVPQADAQTTEMLTEAPPKLNVLGKGGVQP